MNGSSNNEHKQGGLSKGGRESAEPGEMPALRGWGSLHIKEWWKYRLAMTVREAILNRD